MRGLGTIVCPVCDLPVAIARPIPGPGAGGICRRCKVRPSTGVIFAYCTPCFDEYEAEVLADEAAGGKHVPSAEELEAINDPFVKRSN